MGGKQNARPGKAAKTKRKEAVQKPEGAKDVCKRTPTSSFDPYKGKRSYTVESVVLKRINRGAVEYRVTWANLTEGANTWEPVEHLAAADGKNAIESFETNQRLLLEQVRLCYIVARACACLLSHRAVASARRPPRPQICRSADLRRCQLAVRSGCFCSCYFKT